MWVLLPSPSSNANRFARGPIYTANICRYYMCANSRYFRASTGNGTPLQCHRREPIHGIRSDPETVGGWGVL